jgi:hypothetical protein
MELKKIKHFNELSQETMAFSAQLWVDGKHIADISNNGEGGSNNVYPTKDNTWDNIQQYDNLDIECKIFEMVMDDSVRKDNQSKGFVIKKDGKYKLKKFTQPISTMKKYGNYTLLIKNSIKLLEDEGYIVLNNNL